MSLRHEIPGIGVKTTAMTSPWAWLLLVAMVTAFTPHLPQVDAVSLTHADHVAALNPFTRRTIPRRAARDQDEESQCPGRCTCSWRTFRSNTGLDAPLRTVNCSGQGLLDFPDGLPNGTQVLDMSHNKLQNLTTLPRLSRLRVLDLSSNWLRHLDNRWVFEHVPLLRALNLADNALRSIQHGSFSGLPELRRLDLARNVLRRLEIHAFSGLGGLKELHLDRNELYELRREWFLPLTSLSSLHLSHNNLPRLEPHLFDRLARLQQLDLSHNALRLLPEEAFAGLSRLQLLNLSGNTQMRGFPAQAARALKSLNILLLDGVSAPRLPSFAVSSLQVAELTLSFMPELRVVERSAFFNLTRLSVLQLHDNPRLVFLHPAAFSSLPALRHLLLHNNALLAVPAQLPASLPALSDLHIHHNPLRCDCNIFWLRQGLGAVQRRHNHHELPTVGSDSSQPALQGISSSTSSSVSFSSSAAQQSEASVNDDASGRTTQSNITFNVTSNSSGETMTADDTNAVGGYSKGVEREGIQGIDNNSDDGDSSSQKNDNVVLVTSSDGSHGGDTGNAIRDLIKEPDRVSCFFPSGQSHMPLTQLPLQYFSPTCPPSTLPLFSPNVNVTLGDELWLECQGLGVPVPTISWILPSGQELNVTSSRFVARGVDAKAMTSSPVEIVEETLLYIRAVTLTDSGSYGCKASNALGEAYSATYVHVHNRPLQLTGALVSNDYMTVSWRGSVSRHEMEHFQLFYRDLSAAGGARVTADDISATATSTSASWPVAGRLDPNDYHVVNLRGPMHKCTLTGLRPSTMYQVCLVYKHTHRVQCRNYSTTAHDVRVRPQPSEGIVRVSRTQVGVGLAGGMGVVLLVLVVLVVRRVRRRKEYREPVTEEEKAAIPLEGLAHTVPSTPLTSSRTALLTHSQI